MAELLNLSPSRLFSAFPFSQSSFSKLNYKTFQLKFILSTVENFWVAFFLILKPDARFSHCVRSMARNNFAQVAGARCPVSALKTSPPVNFKSFSLYPLFSKQQKSFANPIKVLNFLLQFDFNLNIALVTFPISKMRLRQGTF